MTKAKERDPIALTEKYLLKHKIVSEKEIAELRVSAIQSEMDKAADEADAAPHPAVGRILTTNLQRQDTRLRAEGAVVRFGRYDLDG